MFLLTAVQLDFGMRPVAAFLLQQRANCLHFARAAAAQRHIRPGLLSQPFIHVYLRTQCRHVPTYCQTLPR